MSVWRNYNQEEKLELLKTLVDGLARHQTYIEETYIGKLSEDLRVKAELNYENYEYQPVSGINVKIINIRRGEVDNYYFDFDRFWAGDSRKSEYSLSMNNGWSNKVPTSIQLLALNRAIHDYVDMYREDYY